MEIGPCGLRSQESIKLLIRLLEDFEVAAFALYALGKLRAFEALPKIQTMVDHQNQLIRKEARRAMQKIENAQDSPN